MASASPHEITLVEETLKNSWSDNTPEKLVGDKAYDSDPMDEKLKAEQDIELIAPNSSNRKIQSQDGIAQVFL